MPPVLWLFASQSTGRHIAFRRLSLHLLACRGRLESVAPGCSRLRPFAPSFWGAVGLLRFGITLPCLSGSQEDTCSHAKTRQKNFFCYRVLISDYFPVLLLILDLSGLLPWMKVESWQLSVESSRFQTVLTGLSLPSLCGICAEQIGSHPCYW